MLGKGFDQVKPLGNCGSKRGSIEIASFKCFLALAGVAQWVEHQLVNKGSLVRFPVRADAWVVSQVRAPVGGM